MRQHLGLGRYMFVELDYQNQSFLPITATSGVDAVVSAAGVLWPVLRADDRGRPLWWAFPDAGQVSGEVRKVPIGDIDHGWRFSQRGS
jgi:transcription antitermination factor NusG